MAHYLISDVHLELDQPERSERLARWAERLQASDTLIVVGDLCDFWFASRQSHRPSPLCAGLRALRQFRQNGGDLTILAGNHDTWLGPYYEQELGARFVPDALDLEQDGLRIHLVHGHRLGGVGLLKRGLESRAFLSAFRMIPEPLAVGLRDRLDQSNDKHRSRDDRRQLAGFKAFVAEHQDQADLFVIGHLHTPVHQPVGRSQLIVPGSWHRASCFVKVENGAFEHVVEPPGELAASHH